MIKFWEDYPPFYDIIQIVATGGFLRVVRKELESISRNKKILDLGSGTGNFASFFASENYLGVEINRKYIQYAKTKYPNHKFIQSDITQDTFPDIKFDVLLMVNVLHHLSDSQISKLISLLKVRYPKKEIIIIESYPYGFFSRLLKYLDAGENFREFSDLEKLLEKKIHKSKSKILYAPFRTYRYLMAEGVL